MQRGIRAKILEQYPKLESVADEILPKKGISVIKWFSFFDQRRKYKLIFALVGTISILLPPTD